MSGAAFAPKIMVIGVFGLVSCLDVHVFVDRIQGIHLLAFVLVKTFYLYVEDCVLIYRQILGLIEIFLQGFLVVSS